MRHRGLAVAAATREAPVLALVGASPGAGTTALVRDLATVSGTSSRLLVVDGDLRRPRLSAAFGVADDAPGLADVLAGRTTATAAVRPCDGFDLLPAGPVPQDAGELLASPAWGELLVDLRARYDRVLIDAAASGETLDGALAARHADGAVLVVREGSTTVDALEEVRTHFATVGVRAVAAVLVGARTVGSAPRPVPSEPGGTARSVPTTPRSLRDAGDEGREIRSPNVAVGTSTVSSATPRSLET